MPIWNWKKEILTIPNMLSLIRLGMIPIYVVLYLRADSDRDYLLAGSILAVSCLTDFVDGKIARHFHMVSHVGMILDPMADKFTQLTLILCLSSRYPLLYPVLALFVVKEVFQLFAMILSFRQGKALTGALVAGKICTAILFLSLIVLVLFPQMNTMAADLIILTDVILLVVSFVSYIRAYYGKHKKVRDLKNE